jgi:hypothetical protein
LTFYKDSEKTVTAEINCSIWHCYKAFKSTDDCRKKNWSLKLRTSCSTATGSMAGLQYNDLIIRDPSPKITFCYMISSSGGGVQNYDLWFSQPSCTKTARHVAMLTITVTLHTSVSSQFRISTSWYSVNVVPRTIFEFRF